MGFYKNGKLHPAILWVRSYGFGKTDNYYWLKDKDFVKMDWKYNEYSLYFTFKYYNLYNKLKDSLTQENDCFLNIDFLPQKIIDSVNNGEMDKILKEQGFFIRLDENGKYHGNIIEYDGNGVMRSKTLYSHGKKYGWSYKYDGEGRYLESEYYQNDVLITCPNSDILDLNIEKQINEENTKYIFSSVTRIPIQIPIDIHLDISSPPYFIDYFSDYDKNSDVSSVAVLKNKKIYPKIIW